ncbi:DivIVA domain-containing protein [Micromonospora sagamiensis]|uniref:DivIVA domain-containing protein n=1 Tax=Micromonospora sagamiensis TaxID=47875 RepID=A0A562WAC0_9ACTN|nr:DivIVA domain-containing protein [Micromonospora sagamiensis]TWJ26624.1 DivIVA domain-containing protein [Micromonospora sagamiensis]
MRHLVERLFGRRPARHRRADGAPYRSRFCVPLLPAQIRDRRFRRARLGRRGLDPDDVQRFLDRVALELADAQQAAERARQETTRIKDALRRWQSEQARTRDRYALYR